jgi:hypothetical protein
MSLLSVLPVCQIEQLLLSPLYPRTGTNHGPQMLFLVLKTDDVRNQTSEE